MNNKSFSDMFYDSFKSVIDCFNRVIVYNNKFTFEELRYRDSGNSDFIFTKDGKEYVIYVTFTDIRSPFNIYKILNEFAFENGLTNEFEYEELRDELKMRGV
ncbi:MAG: hypothetical protein ACLR60_03565 [Clostridium paraputrificum]